MTYDEAMFEAQNGGAVAWLIGWPILLLAALYSLMVIGLRRNPVRFVIASLFLAAAFLVSGCTSPLVEVNRTGSILPDIRLLGINDSLNGSANGNTVPVSAVP